MARKPKSRMDFIFIDDEGNARNTRVGAMFETDAQTWENFKSWRFLESDGPEARFILDYYNSKGDLTDSIRMDARAFERITNEKALSNAEYVRLDKKYWEEARAKWRARKAA